MLHLRCNAAASTAGWEHGRTLSHDGIYLLADQMLKGFDHHVTVLQLGSFSYAARASWPSDERLSEHQQRLTRIISLDFRGSFDNASSKRR
jgi:hypothetical protein